MTRTVSFCFDDGFRATADKVRALFDDRGLGTSFCVLARPDLAEDPFIRAAPIADWAYWREAAAAGHEVAPHGWAHERLGDLDTAAACAGLDRTLDTFAAELPGFDPGDQLFHLAYLAAPAPVIRHLGERTLGVRRAVGRAGLNPPGRRDLGGDVDCITFGDPAGDLMTARLDRFLDAEAGWLVLVLHGLDSEGWGPVPGPTLERQLDRLLDAGVRIVPAGQAARERL
ncbi:polysaccharide deacetylase family protein [Phenylobacterium sp.]|uniref:polysaccharide deacetylase family protein n=1 Tax=Phenylobacterium sp. TaxID=1871053 RepID=UPI0025E2A24A|nr:polysaccharide deacetylase family protein [Phenylobacterium sp.]